ncbi:MAG TPA: hypothetical protein VLA10_00320, partial [Ilumatobacter sp.]|nr:hypothetical protein [Ilumatobacter sp.]
MSRRALAATALLTGAIVAVAVQQPVASQTEPVRGLVLETQNFAVNPGSLAHFELLVTADVPEIAPTTTTTTTTVATTVATPPEPGAGDPGDQPGDGSGTPVDGTTVTESTTPAPTTTIARGPEMIVQLRAHRRLTDRAAVDAAVGDDPGPVIDILQFELSDVSEFDETTGERRLILDVPINSGVVDVDALDLTDPGVYPVTIQVRRNSVLVTEHTTFLEVIDVTGVGRGPFRFTVHAALPDPGPDPSGAELAATRAGLSEIADLAAATNAPLSLALPPQLLRTVIDADPSLSARLTDVLDSNDGLVVLPDLHLDPSAAVEAGLTAEFRSRVTRGRAILSELFPDLSVATSAWPTSSTLTAPGAALLRDVGIPILVVPFERYSGYQGSLLAQIDTALFLNAQLPDGSTLRMLVVDPVTQLLDPDRASDNSPAEDAVQLMATTSVRRYELSPDVRTMVLTTADLGAPSPEILRYLEQFVAEHPDYSF